MVNENKNPERLTWAEIKEKYPNQVVGLEDVEWVSDRPGDSNIKSAIVRYISSDFKDILKLQAETNDKIHATTTGIDSGLQSGLALVSDEYLASISTPVNDGIVIENPNLERLTWEDILKKYPDQWVGLTDIEWDSEHSADVKTAIVRYINTDMNTLLELQADTKGGVYTIHTGQGLGLQIGLIM